MSHEAALRAHQALEAQHRRIGELRRRITEATELETLVAALEELGTALVAHFAEEEQPEGLYDTLGVCGPSYRDALADLVDDHYRLLATVRGLTQRSRALVESAATLIRQDAVILADALGAHERREHRLLERVLTEAGATTAGVDRG